MSEQHAPFAEPSPLINNVSLARAIRLPCEETQTVAAAMHAHLQTLSPLISERMGHVLWRSFPPEQILARDQRPEYARGRAWAGFFLRYHPHCMIDGERFDWTNFARFMRHDRSTIQRGVIMLLARMKDGRFQTEAYQLSYISAALEMRHGWGRFDLGPFQAAERVKP